MALPRYTVTERTYHQDKIYEPGDEIDFKGIPPYYMQPINEEAKKMKQGHPETEMILFDELPKTIGEEQDVKDALELKERVDRAEAVKAASKAQKAATKADQQAVKEAENPELFN